MPARPDRQPCLLARLMGPDFAALAPALQRFHQLQGYADLRGQVVTHAPATQPARLLAWLLGTPRQAVSGALGFDLCAGPDQVHWTRLFPRGQQMDSLLCASRAHPGQLEERLGPARLRFTLHAVDGALHLRLAGMRFYGVPCPRAWLPRVTAVETGQGARLHFHIEASLPGIGLVTRYAGHLEPVPGRDH